MNTWLVVISEGVVLACLETFTMLGNGFSFLFILRTDLESPGVRGGRCDLSRLWEWRFLQAGGRSNIDWVVSLLVKCSDVLEPLLH